MEKDKAKAIMWFIFFIISLLVTIYYFANVMESEKKVENAKIEVDKARQDFEQSSKELEAYQKYN